MRCHLAAVLYQSSSADILILDEPTNFLDVEATGWLMEFLQDYSGALLIISHDLDMVQG